MRTATASRQHPDDMYSSGSRQRFIPGKALEPSAPVPSDATRRQRQSCPQLASAGSSPHRTPERRVRALAGGRGSSPLGVRPESRRWTGRTNFRSRCPRAMGYGPQCAVREIARTYSSLESTTGTHNRPVPSRGLRRLRPQHRETAGTRAQRAVFATMLQSPTPHVPPQFGHCTAGSTPTSQDGGPRAAWVIHSDVLARWSCHPARSATIPPHGCIRADIGPARFTRCSCWGGRPWSRSSGR
jgi:hypothetical protein